MGREGKGTGLESVIWSPPQPCWFLLKYVTGEKWREEKYSWQIKTVTQDSPCLSFPTGDSFSWLQLWQQKYPTSILPLPSQQILDYVQIITLSSFNSRRRQPYPHFWVWIFIVVVQSLSCVLFVTPWTVAHEPSLSFIISWSLIELMSIELSCHPTISSFVTPFSSCPQCFPASGSFPMSQLFTSGGQNIRA